MAAANETLQRQMEKSPAGFFDIEEVEDADRVIEMVRKCLRPFHAQDLKLVASFLSNLSKSCVVTSAGRGSGGAQRLRQRL